MRKLRVLLLMHHDLVPPDSIEGLSDAEIHPWKMEFDVRDGLRMLDHEVLPLGVEDELLPIRRAIDEFKPHIAFNLLMRFHGVGIYDAHVVSYLELLKTAYTGCNPRGLLLASDKALSKQVLAFHRIRTPRFGFFRRGGRIGSTRRLRWPLIVKSTIEHASTGISQASIVHDAASLAERVQFVHERVGTDAIAEEYIAGREFTVGVLGNHRLQAFPVWELRFTKLPEGTEPIATASVKWNLKYQEKLGVVSGPAEGLDEKQQARIRHEAKRTYKALGMTGYGRIDMRMDDEGRVYVLEANPNPDLCFGEDFAEGAERVGLKYEPLLQRILNLGLRHRPAWKDST